MHLWGVECLFPERPKDGCTPLYQIPSRYQIDRLTPPRCFFVCNSSLFVCVFV